LGQNEKLNFHTQAMQKCDSAGFVQISTDERPANRFRTSSVWMKVSTAPHLFPLVPGTHGYIRQRSIFAPDPRFREDERRENALPCHTLP
jgi:hypothetical protein